MTPANSGVDQRQNKSQHVVYEDLSTFLLQMYTLCPRRPTVELTSFLVEATARRRVNEYKRRDIESRHDPMARFVAICSRIPTATVASTEAEKGTGNRHNVLMSHQMGAESITLPCQIIELIKKFRQPNPAQMINMHVPTFQATKDIVRSVQVADISRHNYLRDASTKG